MAAFVPLSACSAACNRIFSMRVISLPISAMSSSVRHCMSLGAASRPATLAMVSSFPYRLMLWAGPAEEGVGLLYENGVARL